jgi:hypothetical protein
MGYLGEVREKLTRYLGAEKADECMLRCLRGLGFASLEDLDKVQEPQMILRFGNCLITRSGMAEVIGRNVRVYAILRGAKLNEDDGRQLMDSLQN